MDDRASKRDLVLAPSEYAYMQDVTKGIVKTYTGPTVINPRGAPSVSRRACATVGARM